MRAPAPGVATLALEMYTPLPIPFSPYRLKDGRLTFSLSCNSDGAWKIESATFSGRHLLLTILQKKMGGTDEQEIRELIRLRQH